MKPNRYRLTVVRLALLFERIKDVHEKTCTECEDYVSPDCAAYKRLQAVDIAIYEVSA